MQAAMKTPARHADPFLRCRQQQAEIAPPNMSSASFTASLLLYLVAPINAQ
jgi:hypothetical protein